MSALAEPSPAQRVAAWARDDPDELRRAADEWEALGFDTYARYLRAYADGERPPMVPAPW